MKVIKTNKGQDILVDNVDFDLASKYKWYIDTNGYAARSTHPGKMYLHRYILNPTGNIHIDHINGNTLDNRRCNIRLITHSGNMKNRKRPKNNKTGYKGVSLSKSKEKCCVYVTVNSKHIYLGTFLTAIEAAKVYDQKAKEFYGEFARTNF